MSPCAKAIKQTTKVTVTAGKGIASSLGNRSGIYRSQSTINDATKDTIIID